MASNAAKRQKARDQVRLCRERKRNGEVRLCVVVDEVELIGVLRLAGFIERDARDPEHTELEQLLQHVIELWIAPPESGYTGG